MVISFRVSLALMLPGALWAQAPSLEPLSALPGRTPVLFAEIQDVALMGDGGVVVLDLGNRTLYRFSAAGRFVDSLGRRGRGPGEFQFPAGVVPAPGGGFGLLDIGTRALLWWTPSGTHRAQTPLLGDGVPIELRSGFRGEAWIKAQSFRDGQFQFGAVPLEGGELTPGSWLRVTSDAASSPTCPFCPWTPWPSGGVVVAAADTAYILTHLRADGTRGRTWTRSAPARRRSAEELRELAARLRRGPGGGASNPEAGAGAAPAATPWLPRVASLGVDGHGRLWALVHHGGETRAVIDVFASDGRFLTTLRPGPSAHRMRVAGDRVALWGSDPSDEPAVWVFRIREQP